MRINFNTNQLQQNHTNFKSKLPSVNATYNIDKVYAKFIPDYWQEFARDSLSITHYCRDKAIAESPLKETLEKLYNNFDNNILSLSCIKKQINSKKYTDEFVFRLYKNTDEFLKDSKSIDDFNTSKNYLNREIRVKEVLSGNYSIEINGSAKIYEKKYDDKDVLHKNVVDVLTKVLNDIVKPQTDAHRAIYNTYNSRDEEIFLKAFREQ
ncbi:hypothetical protein J6K35_03490 [bacterium]|jgi:hypothetical protein|nr:hypothetical protein [bacterium]CCZ50393.1 unknown [Acinetobacter sp. CAG:196]DAA94342.1 MAG TPA: hypothetical protein CPT88_09785 [Candidatus Gastranaerophilales bacterium HUM_8]DAA99208.1 MAG TPA: hypothetical protein CPT89_10620 [Candidatus Gastranaerophilales bacterium HUM_11]DAB17026.1 MAG TPA: hypothetical protein CPU00_01735 [Candidatus Gastranaerophilales bacterium HUM_18]